MGINVAYDHQIFCIQRYGGISRYFVEIASRLREDARFRVHIIAPLHFNAYLSNYSGNVIGQFIEPIPKTARARWFLNSFLSSLCIKSIQPDILHETYNRVEGYKCKRSRCIITIHDMVHEKFPHFFPNDNTPVRKSLAVKRADHIICVSENTKKDLIQLLDVPPEKITVIYHGSTLTPVSQHVATHNKQPKPYLLFVGRRALYKNFKGLLHAYSMSKKLQIDFDIVCFGADRISDEEKRLIQDLGINNKCINFVNGNDRMLAEYYCNAAAFVYPSFYEGFGIPLLEAMACCCPIVCSNTSCFVEIAGDAAEFFVPSNIESMLNAIHRVVYSPFRTKELIELGQEKLKLFSWDKTATQTAEVYAKLF
jgi:glycosyltransferase involved in cell wall biosynthesis